MTIGSMVRTRPVLVLYGLMIATLVALLPLPPLLQDQAYHQFADQRELFGIQNFWNVVSNLPFVAVGGSVCCDVIATRRLPCFLPEYS
jgi:hypothetical protein